MKLRRSGLSIALNELSKRSSGGATYAAGRSLLRSYRNPSRDQAYRQVVPDGTPQTLSSCLLVTGDCLLATASYPLPPAS